jgi:hypothetical protein
VAGSDLRNHDRFGVGGFANVSNYQVRFAQICSSDRLNSLSFIGRARSRLRKVLLIHQI